MITILSQIHTAMGSDEDISDQVTPCCFVALSTDFRQVRER